MPRSLRLLCALALILALTLTLVTASEPKKPMSEWKSAKEAADFLLSLSPGDVDVSEIPKLIRQLGDDDFESRETAAKRLHQLGPLALPALEIATKSRDAETARGAQFCQSSIVETWMRFDRVWTAIRILREDSGIIALDSILAILPVLNSDVELDDFAWLTLETAIQSRAENLNRLDRYLHDRVGARRAAAACFLSRLGNQEQRSKARELLNDPVPEVRLRTAQGLLASGDISCISTLIELLAADPLPLAWQAEELLIWWSDGRGPTLRVGGGGRWEREACQSLWRNWNLVNTGSIDRSDRIRICRKPGLLLGSVRTDRPGKPPTLVGLIGCDGSNRLRIELPVEQVLDCQILPDGHLLTSEHETARVGNEQSRSRVVERSATGAELWSSDLAAPSLSARRLVWGGTFISGVTEGWVIHNPDHSTVRQPGPVQVSEKRVNSWWCLPDGGLIQIKTDTPSPTRYRLDRLTGAASIELSDGEARRADFGRHLDRSYCYLLDSGATFAGDPTGTYGFLVAPGYAAEHFEPALPNKPRGNRFLLGAAGRYLGVYRGVLTEYTRVGEVVWEMWPALFGVEDPRASIGMADNPMTLSLVWRKVGIGFAEAKCDRVARLRECVRSPFWKVREGAVAALRTFPDAAPETADLLTSLLADESESIQVLAMRGLRELNLATVERLEPLTRDARACVRYNSLHLLGTPRRDGVILSRLVQRGFADPDSDVRGLAARLCGSPGINVEVVLPLLIEALECDEGVGTKGMPVWIAAMNALGRLGAAARPASLAALGRMSRERAATGAVSSVAVDHITSFGSPEQSAEFLSDSLEQHNLPEDLRTCLIEGLGRLGCVSEPSVPLLESILHDGTPREKTAAREALSRILKR